MKVVCYGDSNTFGYDPRDWWGGRYERPWPEILERYTGWEVSNRGENGLEIPTHPVLFPEDTDLLIVMLGSNDLLQQRSPEEASGRLEGFLKSLDLPPEKVLLLPPPPMKRGAWVPDSGLPEAADTLAGYCQQLATVLGIRFADQRQWDIPLAFDGVHFTEAGHSVFAEGLLGCLKREGLLWQNGEGKCIIYE